MDGFLFFRCQRSEHSILVRFPADGLYRPDLSYTDFQYLIIHIAALIVGVPDLLPPVPLQGRSDPELILTCMPCGTTTYTVSLCMDWETLLEQYNYQMKVMDTVYDTSTCILGQTQQIASYLKEVLEEECAYPYAKNNVCVEMLGTTI